ncbi:MAG: hypothetical protein NTY57_07550 [Solirubrobacterales bacterium]|nr:hypothetical protein [Solirubrobacterales bacterium]
MAESEQRDPFLNRVGASVVNGFRRAVNSWGGLNSNQRLAGAASALLFGTLLLPWFQQTQFDRSGQPQTLTVSGMAAFTFVEASVLLVCCSILVMLFARGEQRAFHLPGGDGSIIALGGGWSLLLLVIRVLFYQPTHVGADTGIKWGVLVAIAAAVAVLGAGLRMRALHIPEPGQRRRTRVPSATPPPEATVADDQDLRKVHFGGIEAPVRPATAAAGGKPPKSGDDPTLEQLAIPLDDQPSPRRLRPKRDH